MDTKKMIAGMIMAVLIIAATGSAATAIQIGGGARETIDIKNEKEMVRVVIELVDGDAYDNRTRVLAPIYILGCKTTVVRMPNAISAEIPSGLLKFLTSPEIKRIVARIPATPRPPIPAPVPY